MTHLFTISMILIHIGDQLFLILCFCDKTSAFSNAALLACASEEILELCTKNRFIILIFYLH